ncbi:hypothetical protein Hanom_Chr04g00299041 [Helianthus anomalus]
MFVYPRVRIFRCRYWHRVSNHGRGRPERGRTGVFEGLTLHQNERVCMKILVLH